MRVEAFKDCTIAYMRSIGEYGPKNEKLMGDFKNFLKENTLFNEETILLGIALDNPKTTPLEKLRYDVGIILTKEYKIDLNTRKIDGGKYAIYEVSHTKDGVMEFWQNITKLTEGLSIDYDKPIIERYAINKIINHLCEFCVPLK